MSKRGAWTGDASFAGGERSDQPPHLIPEDGLLKADNVVLSKTGRISKRGPVQPYLEVSSDDLLFQLAQYQFNNYNPANRGFALGQNVFSANRWYTWSLVNPPITNRAGTLSSGQQFIGGNTDQNSAFAYISPTSKTPPAFNYLGIPFFPAGASNSDGFYAFAGNPSWGGQPNVTPVASGAVTVTAGDPLVTVATAVLPAAQIAQYPGNFIYIYKPDAVAANRHLYIGVITNATTGTVSVYPTPQTSFSGSCFVGVSPYAAGPLSSLKGTATTLYVGNAFPPTEIPASVPTKIFAACTHQNRIVCAPRNIQKINSISASVQPDPTLTEDAVIVWSSIAGAPSTASSTKADGILPLQIGGWPASQSLTLETSGIVSLVSMDANNLMVLCSDKTIMLSGNLGTVLPLVPFSDSSINVRTVAQRVGCLDNLSVQRTPLGVMFASRDGVYVTDGASFSNVMEGKIQTKWNAYVNTIENSTSTKRNPITGSAFIGETHYVLFTQFGPNFVCDIYNNFSWTTMSVGTGYTGSTQSVSYGYGIQDWRGRSEVYAPKVNNVNDTAKYCDRIVLLDSILSTDEAIVTSAPSSGATINGEFAQSVDAGSPTPVNAEIWTRAYTFGDPSSLKAYKTTTMAYLADAKVNNADPINFYYAEGLEPTPSFVTSYTTIAPSPLGDTAPTRVSLVPRVIDNGVSFGFKTNYVRTDSPPSGPFSSLCRFSLYQIALNFVNLRLGRTKQ